MRNATFISNAPQSASETPYSRGGGKQIYFNRNIQWRKSANMEVSNIHHIVTSDDLCGSYDGLLLFTNCADMDVHDLTLFARKYKNSGRSTYDLVPNSSVDMRFSSIRSNDILNGHRWGVIGSSYLKDAVYEDCELNRIDSHQGVYNLTVRDCTVGYHALTLTGQGTLDIIRTTIISDAFMTLRYDYGSTWNGDVYILDSTLRYRGQWAQKIFNYQFSLDPDGSPHDYGYECRMPNIYIDDLTVDNRENTERTSLGVVFNWDTSTLDKIPASYWPRVMQVNSVHFINNEGLSAAPRVQLIDHPADGLDGNYAVTDVRFHLDSADGEDVTRELWSETPYQTAHAVTVTAAEQPSTENRLTLTRDGTALYTDRLLEGTVEETWTDPGLYRLTVRSADTRKGAAGESVWTVRILGTRPVVLPTLYDADGEAVSTEIPEGPFSVRAEVLCAGPLPEGSQLVLAVYDADGAMGEICLGPLETGETAATFAVENTDGTAASGKVFLLGPGLEPLSPAAPIAP